MTRTTNSAATAAYRIHEDAQLEKRNTFGVAATAPMLVEVKDSSALPELFTYAMLRDGPVLVLGGGSNVLFAGDPQGAVLALTAQRIAIIEDDGDTAIVRADAGVSWHDLVLWTLGHGLCGLENLALIPGTVGAAPIQNIGAYGVEVRDSIYAVEAFDRHTSALVRLCNDACAFAYRDSLFKRDPDHYVVTAVEFALSRMPRLKMDYAGIGEELQAMGITGLPRASQVAEAVIRIRHRKLPDPEVLGNAGSFFKNPMVAADIAEALLAESPSMPMFRGGDADTRKLSAAWLIDQCGWKGYRDQHGESDAGIAESPALVLVNYGNASGAQLLHLAHRVAASVQARFGVAIEPEPRIIGGIW